MGVPPDHLEVAPAAFVLQVVQVAAVAPAVIRRPGVPANVRRKVLDPAAFPNPLENLSDAADGQGQPVASEENRPTAARVLVAKVLDVPVQRACCLSSNSFLELPGRLPGDIAN